MTVLGKQGFADSTDSSNKNWKLDKEYLQGIKVETLKSLLDSGNAKSVYKLVINSVFERETKVDLENQEVRGAFGLVKATYGKESNKWEVEKIEVDDTNKVWLIMAQGTKGIYLMPVVRIAGWWGGDSQCESEKKRGEAKKLINESGVTSIEEWTKKFDNGKEWEDYQNERIKQAMSRESEKGFSITREVDMAIQRKNWWGGKVNELKKGTEEVKAIWNSLGKHMREDYIKRKDIEFLYKNAGELTVKDGWKDSSLYCRKQERYFPLDLVVLGKSTEEVKNPEVTYEGNGQKITIKDEISKVIGVRN